MQTSIYNQQKPFVYLWRDRLLKRYYLGFHNGSKPTYVCSSKPMMEEYRQRPEDFTRRILATGTQEEMAVLERQLLLKRKKHLKNRYYNIMMPKEKGFPILQYSDNMRKIKSIIQSGTKRSEETKKKISETLKRNWTKATAEQKKRWCGGLIPMTKGTKLSKEIRKKMSIARQGRIISNETKRKMSEASFKREAKKREMKL